MSIGNARDMFRNMKVATRFRNISAATTLNPYDKTVVVDSSSGAVTVTLPQVTEAKGQTLNVICPNGNTNSVTIQDQNESYGWSDITVNGANEAHMLISDGVKWTVSPIGIG